MTQEEIIEGNKLIAEFMGYLEQHPQVNEKRIEFGLPEKNYHSSWDWLMPVVKKIGFIHQYPNKLKVDYGDFIDADIDNIWLGVVEFIKWYNKEKELSEHPLKIIRHLSK